MSRVVLDTSFARSGRFDSRQLNRIRGALAGTDMSVVVPEVVVWEWAEHAHGVLESWRNHPVTRLDPLLLDPPAPPEISVDEFVQVIADSIAGMGEVWIAPEPTYREAVRSQVLQQGSDRVGGVKTGAADQVVLACVGAQVEIAGINEAVVLAVGDKKLAERCRQAHGSSVHTVDSEKALYEALVSFVPAAADLEEMLANDLKWIVHDSTTPLGATLSRLDYPGRSTYERARLATADIIEATNLRLAESEGARVGLLDVRIFGEIEITTFGPTQVGPDDFELELEDVYKLRAQIDLSLTAVFGSDWMVDSFEPATLPQVEFDA